MASIIRIKRSSVSGNPSTLAAGELAYSGLTDNGSNGGDRLYIGLGTETAGNAANHIVIGGKFFTDRLDHTAGTLTPSSAIVVDADSKIDVLNVDNLTLNGNAITSTNTNGNIEITPNGSGSIVLDGQNWPQADGTADYYLKTNGSGQLSWAAIPSGSFNLAGNTGTDLFSTGETLTITGSGPLSTAVTDNTVTLSVADATTTTKGVASFDSTDFSVTSGAVSLNDERVQDIVGAMVSGTGATQNGISVGYDDTNGKLTFDVNDPTITIDGDVDGSATMTNLGNTTITVTLDTVNTNTGQFGSSSEVPVITVNGKGLITAVSTASLSTSFTIAADTGTADTFNNGETLLFVGGEGIDTTVTNNTITISGEDASTSNKGIASFNTASFDVASGAVSIKTGGVSNTQLANSSITVGSTTVSLGGTSTSLAGLTEVTVDNLNFNGNEISSTDTNGDISLNPNGTGSVAVNGARITGVAAPTLDTDAANKAYVDNAVTGLDWKMAVNLLATSNVGLTGSTSTLVIDGHAALDSADDGLYRLLLTGQTATSENGIYVYTDNGTSYTLVRATDADTYGELLGSSVYVMEGATYASTGWVQTNHYLTSFDGQAWVQFSGSGSYTAGAGLLLTGTTFDVRVATNGGVEISDDQLQLASSVAGNGLTLSSGVLAVGGTADRITVTGDAVDIASTYVGQSSINTVGTLTSGALGTGFTTVAVALGGTGITSATSRGILFGDGTSAFGVTAASAVDGSFLREDSSGNPYWSNTIDGGTY